MVRNERENLRSVLSALATEEIRRIEERANLDMPKIRAEIPPQTTGAWILVVTMPGEDGTASGQLIGRGFGVYQPLLRVVEVRRGRKVEIMRPMFKNYLFVYCWDVERHARRILACAGVQRIVLLSGTDKPLIVPWSLIDRIRIDENKENPLTLRYDEVRKRRRHNKKARRKALRDIAVQESDLDIVRVRPWGFSKALGTWDEAAEENNGILHKALGIAA